LPTLMQQAVLNREHLDDIIAGMEKVLSEEHKKLLEIFKNERIDEASLNLPGMRREQYELFIKHIPERCYTYFTINILSQKRIRIHDTGDNKVLRIERLPKFIRDFAKKNKISMNDSAEAYKFTAYKGYESEEVSLVNHDHPLFKLSMELTKTEAEKVAIKRCMIKYPCHESLTVEMYNVGILDGTGRELSNQIIYFAKRSNGISEALDPYWLFQNEFEGECIPLDEKADGNTLKDVYGEISKLKKEIKAKRENQLEKVSGFLNKTFQIQYNDTLEKLTQYQQKNGDNKNTILINQMNAALIDIEVRKEERLSEVEHQRNIVMRPPKKMAQLELVPNGSCFRVFPSDYKEIVEKYEHQNGRSNFKMFNAFALTDFYSERFNGEPRFIIMSDKANPIYPAMYLEDLGDINVYTYVYCLNADGEITEYSVKDQWMLLFMQ
ncbi:MAG: hypothetical protein ACYDG2_21995, partial [Ruminiclostridium sp.]